MLTQTDTGSELVAMLNLPEDYNNKSLQLLRKGDSRFIKDLKVNVKNVLVSDHLNEKEAALLGLAIAINQNNNILVDYFTDLSKEKEATEAEIADAVACASLLASNNVFYRFRHFTQKEKYEQLPARIKMNIMMKPVLGKEFFELVSLAVSAVNGCEQCVKSHEQSLIDLGSNEERIFDAVRLSSVVVSLSKVIY
ncbi:MAG: carboxymuconolactone decarboxylase family protein [Cyclobacteriaceae bacterium]